MLRDKTTVHVFCLFLLAGSACLNVAPTNAQDRIQGKVVGFADGFKSEPSITATAKLGDRVTVRIEPLSARSQQQPAVPPPPGTGTANASANGNTAGGPTDNQTKNSASSEEQSWIPGLSHAQILKLVPYLDSRPLKGLYAETVDPDSHTLTFHLVRSDATAEAWTDLLRNPGFDPRVMSFSVGLEDKQQLPTTAKLSLLVIPKQWFIAAIVIFLIILYIFFRLSVGTSLLRDPGISHGYMPGLSILWRRVSADTKLGPFSLARSQMAFWFFLVITSFVLIWMIIGDTDTITQGVLVLIGISAGTALGATAIDSGKRQKTPEPARGAASRGFLNDILSDGTGVSFHRFQIVVWTIVLGFIFSRRVLNHLTMPDFGTNLLTLMGISSGTYLGLKLPEHQAPESPPPESNTAAAASASQDQQGQQNIDQTNQTQQDPASGNQSSQG